MRSVAVAGQVATVGVGVRLGELYDTLAEHGLTIPAGCGPSVGIAGLTLGGGLGILGRKHGLTCDHLLGAQVVLADGRVVECGEHHDGELFWALRGAGGGHFGVVTSLVFRTLPAPAATVFHLTWPPAAAAAVVQAWQAWHRTRPTSWTPPCG
jgi:FAD/FMN-containing dehydrogenase